MESEAAETTLVRDYLGRLHAAGWGLAPARRDELVAEVSAHIDEALRSEHAAGNEGEVVVRNVLERLGPPEEIVRAESEGQPYDGAGAAVAGFAPFASPGTFRGPTALQGQGNPWGPVEIFAVLLLSVGSFLLPLIGPIVGVVLVWVSSQWTRRQKIVGSLLASLSVLWPLSFVLLARF